MTEIGLTTVKAGGLVTIKDKDGNIKAELEITSAHLNDQQLEKLRDKENADKQHGKG